MKFFIVLAATLAFVYADVSHLANANNNIPIISQNADAAPDGSSFSNSFETGNGITQQQSGVLNNANSETPDLQVRGSYAYTSPEGVPVVIEYDAGVQGYNPRGDSLPTPPTTPDLILRALQYVANQPQVQLPVYRN